MDLSGLPIDCQRFVESSGLTVTSGDVALSIVCMAGKPASEFARTSTAVGVRGWERAGATALGEEAPDETAGMTEPAECHNASVGKSWREVVPGVEEGLCVKGEASISDVRRVTGADAGLTLRPDPKAFMPATPTCTKARNYKS